MNTTDKLAEALRRIADAHISDMPAAWNDEVGWVTRQHGNLRAFAREALAAHDAEQAAKAVQADMLPSAEHIKEIASELVKQAMEQAQVFASSWALVGSRFDAGNELDNAEQQKSDLRTIIQTLADLAAETVRPVAAPTPPEPEAKSCLITGTCKHGSWCSEVYCQEHCQFVEAQAAPEAPKNEWRELALKFDGQRMAAQPLTDEDWRTRDSSDTDEGCAALHRAHGIGATTGEQR